MSLGSEWYFLSPEVGNWGAPRKFHNTYIYYVYTWKDLYMNQVSGMYVGSIL